MRGKRQREKVEDRENAVAKVLFLGVTEVAPSISDVGLSLYTSVQNNANGFEEGTSSALSKEERQKGSRGTLRASWAPRWTERKKRKEKI